jgi:hypothetical protein
MSRLVVPCAFVCLILAVPSPARDAEAKPSKVSLAVVKFARDHVGKKVGDGECTGLAIKALESVGAKTTYDFGVNGLDKDYKWGTLVKDHAEAQPGDIVQFRDVETVTKTVTKTATGTTTRTMTREYPHHTAIIARNLGKGKYEVYEQNAGGSETTEVERKKVRENPLDLSGKTKGTVWIYRPVRK